MNRKDIGIFYSAATDVTGKKLAEALKITGHNKKPAGKKMVIGWGAKTKDNVTFPAGVKVLNHPNKIRDNRNKFKTLTALKAAKGPVADFVDASSVTKELAKKTSTIKLPLVGRKNFHQGGKGFWLCITDSHVAEALKEGAQYFQTFIDIKDEYRLHVFGDEVVYAQKKVPRDNMEGAFAEQHAEKVSNSAAKDGTKLDKATLEYALKKVGKRVLPSPDLIIRSNMRGWRFSSVKISGLNKTMSSASINAVKTVGLDFGAVDCCIDHKGNVWIIEINSGPGLDGTPLERYLKAFNSIIDGAGKKTTAKTAKTAGAKTETAASGGKGTEKEKLSSKLELMQEMIKKTKSDPEAAVLDKVFGRMFND